MPIIADTQYNRNVGGFYGLGAADVAVPLLLADPKTGKFSNERFEALKKPLIDAMTRAWSDYQKTWELAQKNTSFWKGQTQKDAASNLKTTLANVTLPRLHTFQDQLTAAFKPTDPLWTSVDKYNGFLKNITQEISLFQVDANTLNIAADMSFYSALKDRAGVVLSDIYQAGAGIIGPSVWLAKNLPWILGVGAVLLIAGPTIAGALTGGKTGAARAFESDVRSARGAIASGARSATKLFGAPRNRRVARKSRR